MYRAKKNTEGLMIREVKTRKITSRLKNHTRETTMKTRQSKRKKTQNRIKIPANKIVNQLIAKRVKYKRKNQQKITNN